MFAMYRVKVEQIILFMKILLQISILKVSKIILMLLGAPVQMFWRRFCENQGRENFVLASCSFKAYCKLQCTKASI